VHCQEVKYQSDSLWSWFRVLGDCQTINVGAGDSPSERKEKHLSSEHLY